VTCSRRDLLRALAVAPLAAACGAGTGTVVRTPLAPLEGDRAGDRAALLKDLDSSVREAYAAYSGGYQEAYLDSLAHDRSLILIDVRPQAVQVGYSPAAVGLRTLFPGKPVTLVSKRLQMNLSQDCTCAWTFDEVSCRILHEGRRLIVPVRLTQTYERRAGRWLVVLAHGSYALPLGEIDRLATEDDELGERGKLGTAVPRDADAILALLQTLPWARKGPLRVIGPATGQDWQGEAAGPMASPRAWLPDTSVVTTDEIRLRISATAQTAWGAATMTVSHGSAGQPTVVPLRVSWVFSRGGGGWTVSQVHASMAVRRDALAEYAFGTVIE
jgi:ketosteroid isomerase-like protein